MTFEEALDILDDSWLQIYNYRYEQNEVLEAFDIAIKSLEMINDCNEKSATKCFECINKIKEELMNEKKRNS